MVKSVRGSWAGRSRKCRRDRGSRHERSNDEADDDPPVHERTLRLGLRSGQAPFRRRKGGPAHGGPALRGQHPTHWSGAFWVTAEWEKVIGSVVKMPPPCTVIFGDPNSRLRVTTV